MIYKYFTLCLYALLLSLGAVAQVKPTQPEEYAYYRNGKKIVLTPRPDELFVTYAGKVSLAGGTTHAAGLTNQLAKVEPGDVFEPVNAIRYQVNARSATVAGLQTLKQQLESNPDVVTAYPAFTIGNDKVYAGNTITFMLKKGGDSQKAKGYLKNRRATVVEEIDLGDKKVYVATVARGGGVFKAANGLYESGLVEYAEPNFTFTGQSHVTPNDDFFTQQWFLDQASDADIDAKEAWSVTKGSSSVVVAVLDGNGYDLDHPDLAGKLVNAYDAVNNDNLPTPVNEHDNHGTPCVGLIAAATGNDLGVAGVGYHVRAMPVAIGYNVRENGKFSTDPAVVARAAAQVVAASGVVAVSNSYSFGSADFAATIQASYASMRNNSRNGFGAVILASTGNDALSTPTVYPANYPFVVGVGASNINDMKANFSNYGSYLDIVAPGVLTLTTDRTSTAGYDGGNYTSFSGTSAACPVAAGVVGLMASIQPYKYAADYESCLLRSADKVNEYPGPYYYSTLPGFPYGTWNDEMGYGRVNAFRALQMIVEQPVITSFSPMGGPSGTEVTITGQNFIGVNSVKFNGIDALFAVYANGTTITATVPPGNVTGPIEIANPLKLGTSSKHFTSSIYCFPAYSQPCTTGDYINLFYFNSLGNNNSGCNGRTVNYIEYPPADAFTTRVLPGKAYNIAMQAGPQPQGFGAWIDYNNDGDFDDSGEFVYKSPYAANVVFSGTVTIPANASTGYRRMRVRSRYNEVFTAGQACATLERGETEDYTIVVGYCIPEYVYACTSDDYIRNFSFNTLVNNNSGCNGRRNNYMYYYPAGSNTTTVAKGKSYPLKVQSGSEEQGFGVWIDYNNDQDFEDAGEFVYASPSAGTGVYSGTVTIPATASTGPRRMRVRSRYRYTLSAGQVCETVSHGETEDYTITIADEVVASSQWNKRYGGSAADNFAKVIRTADGGYLLGGYSASPLDGDKSQSSRGGIDMWIVKTDAAGNKLWDKRYGGPGDDYLSTLIATADGGYLLAGASFSGAGGDKSQSSQGSGDYWVVKISATGTKQWDKRFGGSAHDDVRAVLQLPTGEYLLAGHSASGLSGDKSQASQGGQDYWLVKISATGGKLWDKRFGGSADDAPEALLTTPDGGLLLAGRSASGLSGNRSQASQGGRDYWVVKVSATGSKLWDKRFGGSGNDEAAGLVATGDGNYLLGGLSFSGISGDKSQGTQGSSDFWVVKMSAAGTKLWDKRFGGSLTEELRSVVRTPDGGFLLGGKSNSGTGGDKSQSSRGGHDYWVVKISSGGSKQWDKRFGGSLAEELRTVLVTPEGGLLLGGRSDSGQGGDKSQSSRGSTDYWLVKLSASGGAALVASAAEAAADSPALADAAAPADTVAGAQARVATGQTAPANEPVRLHTYPNPFTDVLTVEFTLPGAGAVKAGVYDSQGNPVQSLFEGQAEAGRTYRFTWQPGPQKAGIYLVRLVAAGAVTHAKVVLVK